MAKISIYITAFNYERYIDKSIQSVLSQTMQDWDLVIINDGSTDNSLKVINGYKDNPQIRIVDQENKGLNVTNNIALRLATGKYIMRLDADDFLDENALLILSNTLDVKPEVDLVYPDYYLVDPDGKVVEQVRRKKIEEEVQLLDLPAHGACTMFRTEVLRNIGGYIEDFTCQDGYEMWLRFIKKHTPYNVNIPLFYYRQHPRSLTKKVNNILKTRREIKRQFVKKEFNGTIPKVLGIVPVTRQNTYASIDPFVKLAGKPLVWHTLTHVEAAKSLDKVVLSSEDDEILNYSRGFSKVQPLKRDLEHMSERSNLDALVLSILERLKEKSGYEPDAVCVLYVNTPLRKSYHIDWAVDTMKIFNVETVISVEEELSHFYRHRKFGLEPLSKSSRNLRLERDAVYRENGAVYLGRTETIYNKKSLFGDSIGHIVMLPEESLKINSEYEFWLAEKILSGWNNQT